MSNSLQYSCLKTPVDRGAWWATVHRIAELDTTEQLTHTHTMASDFWSSLLLQPCHLIPTSAKGKCFSCSHFSGKEGKAQKGQGDCSGSKSASLCLPVNSLKWAFFSGRNYSSVLLFNHLSCVWLFSIPMTIAHQALLSFTTSLSLLRLMSIESIMPSNHLILSCPLLLLPSIFPSTQFSSVAQSCPTLCNPMDCSMPCFPVHHQLPELPQTNVHRVSDAIQASHPLLFPSPACNLSQHQGLFQWVSSSHQVAKVLEFQLQHQSFQWIFMVDFL